MKKNPKKLRLNRETLVLLESTVVAGPRGAIAPDVTSCTYPCNCQTGCTDDQPCMGTTATIA
jgi:hypothetical protein